MKRKLVLGVALPLVAVCAALGFFWPFQHGGQTLTFPGVVEIQEVRLGSKVAGRVEKVFVYEGQRVKPGDPLVSFEEPELKAQVAQARARVVQAEMDLKKAQDGPRPQERAAGKAALEAARARLERLKAGYLPEEIEQAQRDLDAAEADLVLARQDYERADRLLRQRSIGQADYDIAHAAFDRSQGRARAARAHLALLKRGTRQEEIDEAAAEVRRNQANYDLLMEGTRKEDIRMAEERLAEARGRMQELEANLAEALVTAKEPARIEVVAVRAGDLVAPGQPILRVLRDDDIWVKIYVPETQLDKVYVGQDVDVTIDSGERFAGKVFKISSESEFTPRNVQSADERKHQVFGIKVAVTDPRGLVKPGMAATVIVPVP